MQNTIPQYLDRFTLLLMALTCGLCAGANYFSHPLIYSIQNYFSITAAQAQLTVTFAQVSYALGLFFLVPLGDLLKKHVFIPLLIIFAALGLFISGFAQNIYMLWVGTVITGLFTIAAQVLIPFAATLIEPQKTGSVIGLLMSGLFIGILLSTSLAGLLSSLFAWNAIYLLSGVLLVILALLLKPRLPNVPTSSLNYFALFSSMGELVRSEKRLMIRAGVGAFAFASFSTVLATMSLLLAQKPFLWNDFKIGLVGLMGMVGAVFAQYAGKLADKGYSKQLTVAGMIILLLSWTLVYFSPVHIIFFLLGFCFVNLAISTLHICNMNIIYQLRDDAKSRLNAIYMTLYFVGAASGSALGVYGWNHGGWWLTCLFGFALALCSAMCVLLDKRYTANTP